MSDRQRDQESGQETRDERTDRRQKAARPDAAEHADLQDGSLKTHGDVLDPLIPRGTDEGSDGVSESGR